ncbi:MAG TPA: cobalt ECF transporter T component CbiQ [Nocardioidaceae bacterium]|nr:cobalt ECF transporter T component CbiQ [Nocardioidaceae bacterium]
MGGGRNHHLLYRHGDTVVHRLPPQCKLVAVLVFVLVVVSTPAAHFGAFAGYACTLAGVALVSHVPFRVIARRMVVEVPFVAFAILLPFVSHGEKISVLGVAVSEAGLLDAWNLLAKATLGVVASILLAATTEPRTLLLGVERLRLPLPMVQIMQFMFRYADVVGAEMHRMKVARDSRAFHARDVRQLRVVSQSAGALFIRSYERGERVHLAMLSRGYEGSMPRLNDSRAGGASWAAAGVLPGVALVIAVASWLLAR